MLQVGTKPNYSLLGSRTNYSFGNRKVVKDALFTKAIDSIHDYLEINPNVTIPKLITKIYSLEDLPLLNGIREALKSNSLGRWTQCLSASGNKILAYLAVLHDTSCLQKNGEIDINYIKQIIKGFFEGDTGNLIKFDDSAIRHMKLEETYFKFGKNRFAHLTPILSNRSKLNSIATRTMHLHTAKTIQQKMSLEIDFDTVPAKKLSAAPIEAAFGDLHGNTELMLHKLISIGLINIVNQEAWKQLINNIKNNITHADTSLLLRQALKPTPGAVTKTIFLGDIIADRVFNDIFTLMTLNYLTECRFNYKIIASNHDLEGIRYYLMNKNKADSENYEIKLFAGINQDATHSLGLLNDSLNQNKELRKNYKTLMENYLTHLSVFELSNDRSTLYCHALVNNEIFDDIATRSGIENPSEMALEDIVLLINRWFQRDVLSSLEAFEAQYPTFEGQRFEVNYDVHPLLAAAWSNGPLRDSTRANGTKYLSSLNPPRNLRVVHGHTRTLEIESQGLNAQLSAYSTLESLVKSVIEQKNSAQDSSTKEAELWIFLETFNEIGLRDRFLFPLLKLLGITHDRYEKEFKKINLSKTHTTDELSLKLFKEIDGLKAQLTGIQSKLANAVHYTSLDGEFGQPVLVAQDKEEKKDDNEEKSSVPSPSCRPETYAIERKGSRNIFYIAQL